MNRLTFSTIPSNVSAIHGHANVLTSRAVNLTFIAMNKTSPQSISVLDKPRICKYQVIYGMEIISYHRQKETKMKCFIPKLNCWL
jgi:hypothetical protein